MDKQKSPVSESEKPVDTNLEQMRKVPIFDGSYSENEPDITVLVIHNFHEKRTSDEENFMQIQEEMNLWSILEYPLFNKEQREKKWPDTY